MEEIKRFKSWKFHQKSNSHYYTAQAENHAPVIFSYDGNETKRRAETLLSINNLLNKTFYYNFNNKLFLSGFPPEFVKAFKGGFPDDWVDLVSDYFNSQNRLVIDSL